MSKPTPPRCETCHHWLSPSMGRGWCGAVESSPLVTFDDVCSKWEQRKGPPRKRELDFIQDSDPGDEA